ncbi:MAG: 5-formyltetrahydrofolate cyclo-ligase [Nannocystaceae bacterium]|nr:5-formyltetrahydrofolate cyclo-ligase [Myxococcales bacterium]
MDDPKQGLRRRMLGARRGLSRGELAARSRALTTVILGHAAWRDARCVAAFVGVRGEPDTRAVLAATLAAGKRLLLPRVTDDRARIEFHAVDALEALVPGVMGLLEPPPGRARALADADLVLTPGLAFSSAGARLGFGKGHYDRALAPVRDRAAPRRVGVCLRDALDPDGGVPSGPLDVPMHAIATEAGVITCS